MLDASFDISTSIHPSLHPSLHPDHQANEPTHPPTARRTRTHLPRQADDEPLHQPLGLGNTVSSTHARSSAWCTDADGSPLLPPPPSVLGACGSQSVGLENDRPQNGRRPPGPPCQSIDQRRRAHKFIWKAHPPALGSPASRKASRQCSSERCASRCWSPTRPAMAVSV